MALHAFNGTGYGVRPHVAKRDALGIPAGPTVAEDHCRLSITWRLRASFAGRGFCSWRDRLSVRALKNTRTSRWPGRHSLGARVAGGKCSAVGTRGREGAARSARRNGREAPNSLIHVIKLRKPSIHAGWRARPILNKLIKKEKNVCR